MEQAVKSAQNAAALAANLVITYIFAGNAKFTLLSRSTGAHFTYHVQGKKDSKDPEKQVFFVRYLNGPDNTKDYSYLGAIFSTNPQSVVTTKASKAGKNSSVYRALAFALTHPQCEQLEVYHSGACGRCGRELTDPMSIQTGIGPTCREKMGV